MGKGRRDSALPIDRQRELLQRSAGLCEFECCGAYLYYDLTSLMPVNNGEFAHIIPSSADGPRGGGDESVEYIADVSNRIHLCLKHHTLIDRYPQEYPPNRLREMKRLHEEKVKAFQMSLSKTPMRPIVFEARIKQKVDVKILNADVDAAIRNEGLPKSVIGSYDICPSSELSLDCEEYWCAMRRYIKLRTENLLAENSRSRLGDVEYGVFALGPIPLVAYLGYLIGDKIPSRIFQLLRDETKWSWTRKSSGLKVLSKKLRDGVVPINRVALVLSMSFNIDESVLQYVDKSVAVYGICAESPNVNCISSKSDLASFAEQYLTQMGIIQKENPSAEIDLYGAIPVSVAFEIGRRYMPGAFPKTAIYERIKDGWVKGCELE